MKKSDQVLLALRKIIRGLDLHSRVLSARFGLTYPQLVLLDALGRLEEVPVGRLAAEVNLSHATVTGILARLEQKGLVCRSRSLEDRRVVLVRLENQAKDLLQQAPPLMQETFSHAFGQLRPWEQSTILASLERVSDMMQPQVPEAEKRAFEEAAAGEAELSVAPLLDPRQVDS